MCICGRGPWESLEQVSNRPNFEIQELVWNGDSSVHALQGLYINLHVSLDSKTSQVKVPQVFLSILFSLHYQGKESLFVVLIFNLTLGVILSLQLENLQWARSHTLIELKSTI
jgi:hypothetical protein